uniref:Uncharacterized protein n=1 Tax=Strombidium rassoulzadegani TaxID=1082188 RepID=A0A7S3FRN3_9SPIT|mmetsp:Transcript_11398/g.19228  ORF Transcript_11398/g.19228 Transcript_11398/m.19228 type:complete len:262 (+) Transcript_11398:436-1221(+)
MEVGMLKLIYLVRGAPVLLVSLGGDHAVKLLLEEGVQVVREGGLGLEGLVIELEQVDFLSELEQAANHLGLHAHLRVARVLYQTGAHPHHLLQGVLREAPAGLQARYLQQLQRHARLRSEPLSLHLLQLKQARFRKRHQGIKHSGEQRVLKVLGVQSSQSLQLLSRALPVAQLLHHQAAPCEPGLRITLRGASRDVNDRLVPLLDYDLAQMGEERDQVQTLGLATQPGLLHALQRVQPVDLVHLVHECDYLHLLVQWAHGL